MYRRQGALGFKRLLWGRNRKLGAIAKDIEPHTISDIRLKRSGGRVSSSGRRHKLRNKWGEHRNIEDGRRYRYVFFLPGGGGRPPRFK